MTAAPQTRPSDLRLALDASRALAFGGVLVNEAPTFRTGAMPYGGNGDSGNTREGPASAIRELTEERLVIIDQLATPRSPAQPLQPLMPEGRDTA